MDNSVAVLRLVSQRKTKWSPEDRERTIEGFLEEIHQALHPRVLDHLAQHDTKKLESMFLDWVRHRQKRTPEQRIAVMVTAVAKVATAVPFAMADVTDNPDLQPTESGGNNVVSLRSAR